MEWNQRKSGKWKRVELVKKNEINWKHKTGKWNIKRCLAKKQTKNYQQIKNSKILA